MFPASTNSAYRGASPAAWFVTLIGIAWLVPGLIHSFLPDGGAGSIAGIDLTHNGPAVIAIFAWAGATQLAHGLVIVRVGIRYQSLVPLVLAVSLGERSLVALSGWVRHTPGGGHHPPEHYASLALIPAIMGFLWLSLQPTPGAGEMA